MAILDLINQIEQLNKKEVKAGWFESSKYEDGTPVAEVAATQEFGGNNGRFVIPARPFMRPAIANYKTDWAEIARQQISRMVQGRGTVQAVFDGVGETMRGDIQVSIEDVVSPELSPVTLLLRKWKDQDSSLVVTNDVVEQAIHSLRTGQDDLSGLPQSRMKPLTDTGYMLATVTHATVDKE